LEDDLVVICDFCEKNYLFVLHNAIVKKWLSFLGLILVVFGMVIELGFLPI